MGLPNIGPVELLILIAIPLMILGALWRRRPQSTSTPAVYLAPNPYTGPACLTCGHATVPGADHCSACGARLTAQEP